MADDRVSPEIIMRAMRHRSMLSQSVYTKPTNRRVSNVLSEAARRFA